RARFYDPQLGRFISEDPLGLLAGPNPYAYVENQPVMSADPMGLCKCGLKKGPQYYLTFSSHFAAGTVQLGGQTVPNGTTFRWQAEFRNDASHKPECCEVRQLISWINGTAPHHAGFAGGQYVAGHW